ncbi:hypothetical protein DL96DRAFT_1582998 [Flagelloscypha sp. PMI_526]|nr:hypothetical protein DL96DRAFT_1582998 [Flagelloscypha sp. PMI_526]
MVSASKRKPTRRSRQTKERFVKLSFARTKRSVLVLTCTALAKQHILNRSLKACTTDRVDRWIKSLGVGFRGARFHGQFYKARKLLASRNLITMHDDRIGVTNQLLDVANRCGRYLKMEGVNTGSEIFAFTLSHLLFQILVQGRDFPPPEFPQQSEEVEENNGGSSSTLSLESLNRFQLTPERTMEQWEDRGDVDAGGGSSMRLSNFGQASDDEDALMVENLLTTDTSSRRSSSSFLSSIPITPPRPFGSQLPAVPGAPRASRVFAPVESSQSSGSRSQSYSPPPSPTDRRMSAITSENDVLSKQNRELTLKLQDSRSQERTLREENKRLIGNAHELHSTLREATFAQRKERSERRKAERALAPWKEVHAMVLNIPQ